MYHRVRRSVPYGVPVYGVPMKFQQGVPMAVHGPPMKVQAMPIPKSGVPLGQPGPKGKIHYCSFF